MEPVTCTLSYSKVPKREGREGRVASMEKNLLFIFQMNGSHV